MEISRYSITSDQRAVLRQRGDAGSIPATLFKLHYIKTSHSSMGDQKTL